jgi:hypothetical protein
MGNVKKIAKPRVWDIYILDSHRAPYGSSEAAQSTARSSTVTPKERQAQSKRAHSGHSAAISSAQWPERSHFERKVATARPFRAHSGHSAAISSAQWPQRSHFERTVATVQPFRAHSGHSAAISSAQWPPAAAISSAQWPQHSHFERTVAIAQPFRAHSGQSTAGAVFSSAVIAFSSLSTFEFSGEPNI